MPTYQNKKDLFVPLIRGFVYTERRFGASVPLSGRNPITVTYKKSLCCVHTVHNQSAEQSFKTTFSTISGAFKVMCGVNGAEEARKKSNMALDRGLEPDPNSS